MLSLCYNKYVVVKLSKVMLKQNTIKNYTEYYSGETENNYNFGLKTIDGNDNTVRNPSNSILGDERFVQNILSYQLGKILTIVDASTQDMVQRKALKDVVRNSFHEKAHQVSKLMYRQN